MRAAATLTPATMRALVRSAVRAASSSLAALSLSVAFVDEPESRRLNRAFRGKGKPANVLSVRLDDARRTNAALEGEIVLCPTSIAREARVAGLNVRDHTARLFVHGLLHLLGFDHKTARSEAAMERVTTAALRRR